MLQRRGARLQSGEPWTVRPRREAGRLCSVVESHGDIGHPIGPTSNVWKPGVAGSGHEKARAGGKRSGIYEGLKDRGMYR